MMESFKKSFVGILGALIAILIIFGGAFSVKASEISTVQVVSPNGGEQWTLDTTRTITWTATNISPNIVASGADWTFIVKLINTDAPSAPIILTNTLSSSARSYTFNLASNMLGAGIYKARVELYGNSSVFDESDATFNIVSVTTIVPTLNISLDASTPASATLKPGQTGVTFTKIKVMADVNPVNNMNGIQVGSDSVNASSFLTNFKVYDGATLLTSSVGDLIFNGSYYYQWLNVSSFSVPAYSSKVLSVVADVKSTAQSGSIRLGIAGWNFNPPGANVVPFGTAIYGNNMSISSSTPAITVLSPNGGENWGTGNTHDITWKSNGVDTVAYEAWIDLLKGGTYYGSIAGGDIRLSNAQNLTSYSWKVGDMKGGVGPGSDYQVRITYNDVNTGKMLTDNSDNYFSIIAAGTTPYVTVTSPNGGEKWQVGNTYNVNLSVINLDLPICAIDLYKSGVNYPFKNYIANYSPSKKSFLWTIATDIPNGQYKILARCHEEGRSTTYYDDSDNYFSIKSSITSKCTDYDYGFYKSRFNESDVNEICVDPANFDWKAKGWPEHPSGKRGDETIDGWKKRVGMITSPPVVIAPPVIVPPTPVIPDNSSCLKFYYYEGRFDYTIAKEICANVDGFDWKARGWPEHPSGKRGDENIEGWKKRVGMAVLGGSGGGGAGAVVGGSNGGGLLKECLADGTLIKHPDDPKVYVIKDCKKQWIKTAEEFEKNNYDWSTVKESSSVINAYTDYLAAKSNLLKVIGDNQIYRIVDGKKIIVPSPSALNNSGLNLETAATVEKSELNAYPSITLVKTENNQKVYSVNDLGFKKHIINPDVFNSYPNNKWSDVVTISPAEINALPEATLIKGENDYRVYVLEGGIKKWVKTADVFRKRGFKWNEIFSVNSVELNAYTTGNPIK